MGRECARVSDRAMMRRQLASRIRRGGVSREREGLAAATAEIHVPALTGRTGLAQDLHVAKCAEALAVLPDLAERTIGDAFEG